MFLLTSHVLFTYQSCTFYLPVMYFLLTSHVLFTYLLSRQNPWLSNFYFPKYYKVFINKKKYKAHARASVLFLNIQNKNNKSKENKKGKFLTKFSKFIFKGQAPLFSFEKIPPSSKDA